MEFMARYEMKNTLYELSRFNLKGIVKEFKNQASMGLEMTRKKRMHFGLERVKDRSELKRLFKIAKEKNSTRKSSSETRG